MSGELDQPNAPDTYDDPQQLLAVRRLDLQPIFLGPNEDWHQP